MAAPRQMTANTLNALKGWPSQSAVDFVAKLSSTVTVDPVLAGSVVSLNTTNEFVLGVGTGDVMPLFLFNNSDDPDVANDGGTASTDKGVWVPVAPTGQMMALVATGAYELVSTAITGANTTFRTNIPLTAATGNVAASGKLAAATWADGNTIVGIVSRDCNTAFQDNGYGVDAVAFWPYFIPASIK